VAVVNRDVLQVAHYRRCERKKGFFTATKAEDVAERLS
jgi:hypothetical protein